jgi:survival of motor neuron protein-interacting protein 1
MSQPCLPVPHRRKKKRKASDDNETEETGRFDSIDSMDAAEYLSKVVKQANSMPDVFIAPNIEEQPDLRFRGHVPIEGTAASLSCFFSGRADLIPPPSVEYLPANTSAWIEKSIYNFENLRHYLEICKAKGIGGKETDRIAFPSMKERAGWHQFCVGKDEAAGNVNSYFGDHYRVEAASGDDEVANEIPVWEKDIPETGHSPSVRIILQMDQVLVRRVLSHLSHYIGEGWSAYTPQRLKWIYAMLARLEKPVHRDDASVLFGLLKVLTRARSEIKLNKRNDLARLNSLILIIGIYFEQGAGRVMAIPSDRAS